MFNTLRHYTSEKSLFSAKAAISLKKLPFSLTKSNFSNQDLSILSDSRFLDEQEKIERMRLRALVRIFNFKYFIRKNQKELNKRGKDEDLLKKNLRNRSLMWRKLSKKPKSFRYFWNLSNTLQKEKKLVEEIRFQKVRSQ